MPVTEQLNIRLAPGEKQRVAEAARRSDSTVSDYVRQRLFGRQVDDADQALLEMLADIKPMVARAIRTIDGNLAKIQTLRAAKEPRDDAGVAERARKELDQAELAVVADRLQLAAVVSKPTAHRADR